MKTLNRILLLNSLSSGATGVLLAILGSAVADLFGVYSQTPFLAVGFFLVGFAVLVYMEARASLHNLSRLRLIIALDILWVMSSIIILVLQPFNFTLIGNVLTAAVALWVGAMAYFQLAGLRLLQSQQ